MAKRIIRLTESDMNRLVRRIVKEQDTNPAPVGTTTTPDTKVGMCGSAGLKWAKGVIKNTKDFTVNVDPNNSEFIIIRYKNQGCACKREDIFILQ